MTLKEFLDIREHRFDKDELTKSDGYVYHYANGWTDAVKDIQRCLERHGFNLEIPLE